MSLTVDEPWLRSANERGYKVILGGEENTCFVD